MTGPELSSEQAAARAEFREFAAKHVAPEAARWDREERLDVEAVRALATAGYLAAPVPAEHGGRGLDAVSWGLLHEEIGRCCSSLRSILTVHGMACHAIARWGTREQKARWLPRLASGECLGAFALSEPEVGSDAKQVATSARPASDGFRLDGRKKWITSGQLADLFLLLAQIDGKPTAFVVEAASPGLERRPLRGLLGMRAAMLAELELTDCRLPSDHLLGRPGFGFSHVVASALHDGRYTVAWGSVGIAQACLEASLQYADERRQFGVSVSEHQLVQRMLSDMVAGVDAARLLCLRAGARRDAHHPRAILDTALAKYVASTTAVRVASDAVQIHGARGVSDELPVERWFRDARIMEIIEGSTQIQQVLVARLARQLPLEQLRGDPPESDSDQDPRR